MTRVGVTGAEWSNGWCAAYLKGLGHDLCAQARKRRCMQTKVGFFKFLENEAFHSGSSMVVVKSLTNKRKSSLSKTALLSAMDECDPPIFADVSHF